MVPATHDERLVGVVLAGGEGRRMGGDKAIVELEGRPLITYPIEALHEVCEEVAVVAKRDTLLPALEGQAEVWIEPDEPRHPLAGLVYALTRALDRPVLALAADVPLIDGDTLRAMVAAAAANPWAVAVVPRVHGRLEPLCALYRPAALAGLEGFADGVRATDAVAALELVEFTPPDPTPFLNVNRPEDLLAAATLLQS